MKKNVIAMLTAVSVFGVTLAGCGSGSTATSSNASSKSTTSTVATASASEASTTDSSASAETSGSSKKLVFWDKAEYVDEYGTMMKQVVDNFAKENNVEVDYVNVPAADMKQKLMAAIEAGNAPDLIVGDNTLVGQFGSLQQLADVTDVVDSIDFTDAAKLIGDFDGTQYMIPQAFTAPGMYIRKDVWEKAGLSMPTTWDELKEQAEKVNDPSNNFYALGFAMGASGGGDAECFVRTIILDWGGQTVDEDGNVTVNSPETVAAFEYIKSLYDEGLISQDAITGDDNWNNQAYLAKTTGVICNSGSVIASMESDDPDLLANTEVIAYPAGPKGTYTLGGSNVFGIIASGKNVDTAKEFVKYYFSDVDNYESMIEVMDGMWQPVINGLDDKPFWQEDLHKPWLESSQQTVTTYYPAPTDDRAMTCFSNQLCVKAVQEMLVNGTSAEDAVADLEQSFKEVYNS